MTRTPHPGIALASATLVGAMLSGPLAADDTEVFFGKPDADTNIYPNVLFVLDTSGSMNWTDSGAVGTRLARMKQAMDTILDSSANINVGLMRFNGSNGGGAVLHPVTPIDDNVCSGAGCGEVSLSYQIEHHLDDVEEYLNDGTIEHWGNILSMGKGQGKAQEVGLRFNEVDIPQGAKITSARLQFVAYRGSNSEVKLHVRAESADDAARYTDQKKNLSDRPDSSAVVDWSPGSWSTNGTYLTPDLSPVVQEIVNRDGWCGSNSIAMQIRGTGDGDRSARSFNNSNTDAPILLLTYDASAIPASGGCVERTAVAAIGQSSDDAVELVNRKKKVRTREKVLRLSRRSSNQAKQHVGLRFDNVSIPPDADVREAAIEFEVRSAGSSTARVDIRSQSHDDAPTFQEIGANLSTRPVNTARVPWNPPNPGAGSKLATPDLTTLVQAVVGRDGWKKDNAIVFRLDSTEKQRYRTFESFEGKQAAAAKLRVVYRTRIGGSTGSSEATIVARDRLKEIVRSMTATGGTPIVDAYYEAAQYYLGGTVDYGKKRGTGSGHKSHRISAPDSYTGGAVVRPDSCSPLYPESDACKGEKITGTARYITPLADSCQTNHIVFLSDGAPTSNSASNRVRSLIGAQSCKQQGGSELCGRELATWLHETDHNQTISRRQNINTYTIGFNNESDFLGDLASAGGGRYFDAVSAEDLVVVFQNILSDVLSVDTSFVAPGATVNQFNRLTHRDDIYFALFKPGQHPTWDGNLKRYRVANDTSGKVRILDVDGNNAVDAETGFFDKQAKSWWSKGVDGSAVAEGGAAEQQTLAGPGGSGSRQVYTYTGDYPVPSGGVNLMANKHALNEDNARVTESLLGIPDSSGTAEERADYRENLLKWARGVDVLDDDLDDDLEEVRKHIGDPMHARPVILNYANGNDPHTTIYVATNEGFLHAIDREDGDELYAFMPQELLPNIQKFYDNEASTRHPYGLDGALSVWSDDKNHNVTIDSGEKAYLYAGMRRGGHSMYAFDVSRRTQPKLAWTISRGDAGFEELGQTWSRAVPARIMIQGEEKDVLVFGAGYDTNQDPDTSGLLLTRSDDTMGRGIYIVEAATGKLVWSGLGTATNSTRYFPSMNYSIPSDVRVIDVNQDGLMDQFYVGDTGGQVWRFDVSPYHKGGASDLIDGGVMASIGGDALTDSRRFYYEPDVALIENGGERFFSISIGSGWRAHPLDDRIEDRFYMIRSNDVTRKPDGYGKRVGVGGASFWTPITEADLTDVTDDIDPTTSRYGWYLDLEARGEKVLGDSITVNNQIVFTSYRPDLTVDACSTAIGSGVVYAIDVLDGSAALDMDDDGKDEKDDRSDELVHGGIPPEPAALITEDGPTILVGPEQPLDGLDFAQEQRTYWLDRSSERTENDGFADLSDDQD